MKQKSIIGYGHSRKFLFTYLDISRLLDLSEDRIKHIVSEHNINLDKLEDFVIFIAGRLLTKNAESNKTK